MDPLADYVQGLSKRIRVPASVSLRSQRINIRSRSVFEFLECESSFNLKVIHFIKINTWWRASVADPTPIAQMNVIRRIVLSFF